MMVSQVTKVSSAENLTYFYIFFSLFIFNLSAPNLIAC